MSRFAFHITGLLLLAWLFAHWMTGGQQEIIQGPERLPVSTSTK